MSAMMVDPHVAESNPRWREVDEVIYFSLPISDGATGDDWVERLKRAGGHCSPSATSLLKSSDFRPTIGVIYEIAVLKGSILSSRDCTTLNIRQEGERRGLKHGQDISAEIACLIRENFSDDEIKAMGLWVIIVMNEPAEDSDGGLNLLGVRAGGVPLLLCTCPGELYSEVQWAADTGFAFVLPTQQP